MTHQEQISETIIKEIRSNKYKGWYERFNKLNKSERHRIVKDIFSNYCSSILTFVTELDPDIHIQNIGTLKIKPSRKQYINLKKEGLDKQDIIDIIKRDYRKLNGKEKNIL